MAQSLRFENRYGPIFFNSVFCASDFPLNLERGRTPKTINKDRIPKIIKEQALRTGEQDQSLPLGMDVVLGGGGLKGMRRTSTPNLLEAFRAENSSQFSLRTIISRRPSFSYNRLLWGVMFFNSRANVSSIIFLKGESSYFECM